MWLCCFSGHRRCAPLTPPHPRPRPELAELLFVTRPLHYRALHDELPITRSLPTVTLRTLGFSTERYTTKCGVGFSTERCIANYRPRDHMNHRPLHYELWDLCRPLHYELPDRKNKLVVCT